MGSISDKLEYMSDAINDIKLAISEKQIEIDDTVELGCYGDKIREINNSSSENYFSNYFCAKDVTDVTSEFYSGIVKEYSKTLTTYPNETTDVTLTGIGSSTGTITESIHKESSLFFLNVLYLGLLETGYSNIIIKETEFSITVLGFKFYVIVKYDTENSCLRPYIYSCSFSTNYCNQELKFNLSSGLVLECQIIIEGDENQLHIYHAGSNTSNRVELLSIFTGKNLITNNDIYFYHGYKNSSRYYYICEKNDVYTSIYNSDRNPFNFDTYSQGLNTKDNYVCIPLLGCTDTILIYSAIEGRSTIMTGYYYYYKIGSDIYFYNGTYLYKVG